MAELQDQVQILTQAAQGPGGLSSGSTDNGTGHQRDDLRLVCAAGGAGAQPRAWR